MKLGKTYYKRFKERRIKSKFSLFPKVLSSHEQIWLEFYYSYQEYGPIGIAWAGNNWKPNKGWHERFSCSTKNQLKEKLRLDYKDKQKAKESNNKFLKYFGLDR